MGVSLIQAFSPPLGSADLRHGLRYFAPLGLTLKFGWRRHRLLCLGHVDGSQRDPRVAYINPNMPPVVVN